MDKENILREFWRENYMGEAYTPTLKKKVGGFCKLCGNKGVVDTRGTAITAFGEDIGDSMYCMCPNGRKAKELMEEEEKNNG